MSILVDVASFIESQTAKVMIVNYDQGNAIIADRLSVIGNRQKIIVENG
jgi:hypothetical protein